MDGLYFIHSFSNNPRMNYNIREIALQFLTNNCYNVLVITKIFNFDVITKLL